MPGSWEWVIIGGVILLLFGGAKLPKLARSLGEAQTEFKKGIKEGAAEEPQAGGVPSTSTDTPEASST